MTRASIKLIYAAVDALFGRAKARLLARRPNKEIRISVMSQPLGIKEHLSLPGIIRRAATSSIHQPSSYLHHAVTHVAEQYLDAHREAAKAQVLHKVQSFLAQAKTSGVKTDMHTVLGGELAEIFGKVTQNVKKIVETEATRARNLGALDIVAKSAVYQGVQDPIVYFRIVRDEHVCSECLRMHQLDGTLSGKPRVYLLSEVQHSYHKPGDESPKIGGLHPHCRCTLVHLGKGFGFDTGGNAVFISDTHNELTAQRN